MKQVWLYYQMDPICFHLLHLIRGPGAGYCQHGAGLSRIQNNKINTAHEPHLLQLQNT